ncbi:MAG: diguanylate cyclase domain-containing protein [Rhodoferax sp.]
MQFNFRAWHSLKARVTLATLAIFLVSLWSLSFYAMQALHTNMQDEFSTRQRTTVSLLAGQLDQRLNEHLQWLQQVGNEIGIGLLQDSGALQAHLDNRPILRKLFNEVVVVLNAEGQAIAELPRNAGRVGIGHLDVPAVSTALQQGHASIGTVYRDAHQAMPMFAMVVPVHDHNGRVTGALAGLTNLGQPNFLRIVTDTPYGNSGSYLLLDPQQRRIIAASDSARIMTQLPAADSKAAPDRWVTGLEGSRISINLQGVETLAAGAIVPGTGWILWAELPTDEAFAPLRASQQRLLLATLLLSLLVAGWSWWLLRTPVVPVLTPANPPAEPGPPVSPPPAVVVPVPDEIGQLVSAFNLLLTRLAQHARALTQSQTMLARTEAMTHVGSWEWDVASQTVTWSDGLFSLLGVNPADGALPLADQSGYYEPGDFQRLKDAVATTLGTGAPYTLELRVIRADGIERICLASGQAEPGPDGQVLRLLGSLQDITELKQTDLKLQIAASVFDHAHEGITITDVQGTILDVNKAFCRITGYSREAVLGQNPRVLKSERQDTAFYQALWHDLKRSGHWRGEILNRRKNGEVYAELLNISAVRDEHGTVCQYVGLFSDISPGRTVEDRVRQMALFDALTDLPNRRLLADRFGQTMLLNQRNGHFGAVIWLDLDNFKPINDTHGHATGDLLLLEVARRLKACVRQVDNVARTGGDNFVVVLSELDAEVQSSAERARFLAENVRQSLAGPYMLPLKHLGRPDTLVEYRCSASIGATLFGPTETNQDLVFKQAERAMSQAKEAGHNRVVFFQPPA